MCILRLVVHTFCIIATKLDHPIFLPACKNNCHTHVQPWDCWHGHSIPFLEGSPRHWRFDYCGWNRNCAYTDGNGAVSSPRSICTCNGGNAYSVQSQFPTAAHRRSCAVRRGWFERNGTCLQRDFPFRASFSTWKNGRRSCTSCPFRSACFSSPLSITGFVLVPFSPFFIK